MYATKTLITFDMVLPNIRALCQEVEIERVIVTRVTDYIVEFREELPKSAVGKILRKVLRAEEMEKANK